MRSGFSSSSLADQSVSRRSAPRRSSSVARAPSRTTTWCFSRNGVKGFIMDLVSGEWWVVSGEKTPQKSLRSPLGCRLTTHHSPHTTHQKSWRRRRQNFLVFRAVLRVVVARGHNQQIVVHFAARENLAELGDEQPFAEMAREFRQALEVSGRDMPDEIAEPALP